MSILRKKTKGLTCICLLVFGLAGCSETGGVSLANVIPNALRGGDDEGATAPQKSVERDVEAPDVFSVTEPGLWDGRPSLGGVWVAHPDVSEPERVIVRNTANGQFVVGALFKREREIPGPRLQISSDAASALRILAGAPTELNVTALRRESVAVEAPEATAETQDAVAAPDQVAEEPLDPIEIATVALERDALSPSDTAPSIETAPAPAAAPSIPPSPVSNLRKPFIQVGIFSVQSNADRTASQMRSAGMQPLVIEGETQGKPFWRVVVGPADTAATRRELLKNIKAQGFTDAYPVTN